MITQEQKEKEILKKLIENFLDVAKRTNGIYLMTKSEYNNWCSKISYLERALKNARESNKNLKIKLKNKNGN